MKPMYKIFFKGIIFHYTLSSKIEDSYKKLRIKLNTENNNLSISEKISLLNGFGFRCMTLFEIDNQKLSHKTHLIKLEDSYVNDVLSGNKTFEIRFNDRNYKKEDFVIFTDMDGIPISSDIFKITYVLENFYGLTKDFCAFTIKNIDIGKYNVNVF